LLRLWLLEKRYEFRSDLVTKKKPMAMMAMKTSITHNKAVMTTVRGLRSFVKNSSTAKLAASLM
jgi:hypothetical protein